MKGTKKLKGEWKHLGGSVYESKNGDRIHLQGSIKKKGQFRIAATHTGCFFRCMDLMGQNNKRALMLVCEKLIVM